MLLSSILSNAHATPNTRSPFGINSNEIVDDDASIPFIDIFKTSLPFEEGRPWITTKNVEYDEQGWPKNLNGGQAGTRFLYKLPKNTVPEGNYTVLYDGEGVIKYTDDAKIVRREKGKDIISIKAGKDKEFRVKLIIKHTNTENYLRNIRVLMPGGICSNNPFKRVNHKNQCPGSWYLSFEKHHKSIIFNPDYLNYMKDFKVIRFMNMSGITRNPIRSWNERTKVNDATWAGKEGTRGVPLEIMVSLANRLNADPWFNLPHRADNNYIHRYAQYVNANLKPGLKAYVEYTNEAWNTIFSQGHYVRDQGERLQLDSGREKAGYKYFSMRSVEIFDIWTRTFGGTDRLVRVMGSWAGWTRVSEMLLSYKNAYRKTDAIAIAPYFYPDMKSLKKAQSVAQLFGLLYDPKQKHSIPSEIKSIKKHATIAKKFGVDLIAYEGGQHLVDRQTRSIKSHPTRLMIKANKHWRMSKAYTDFMRGWKASGGKLFVNFSAPRTYQWFGSWGTKEYITQPLAKAPKHKALMQFSKRNPCWWRACSSRTIARLQKPHQNPMPHVFSLVKSTPSKKTPKRVASTKPITRGAQTSAIWNTTSSFTPNTNRLPRGKAGIRKTAQHDAVVHRVRNQRNIWSNKAALRLSNVVEGRIHGGRDLSAVWQTHWDNNFLYVRVDAIDDRFVRDSIKPWSDDSIEIYIDADGSRSNKFDGKNDFHLIYRWQDNSVSLSKNSPQNRRHLNIKQTMTRSSQGYTLKTAIPWKTLGVRPIAGKMIGIDIQINDDDSGEDRDGKLAWFSKNNNAWTNPQNFGRLVLGI